MENELGFSNLPLKAQVELLTKQLVTQENEHKKEISNLVHEHRKELSKVKLELDEKKEQYKIQNESLKARTQLSYLRFSHMMAFNKFNPYVNSFKRIKDAIKASAVLLEKGTIGEDQIFRLLDTILEEEWKVMGKNFDLVAKSAKSLESEVSTDGEWTGVTKVNNPFYEVKEPTEYQSVPEGFLVRQPDNMSFIDLPDKVKVELLLKERHVLHELRSRLVELKQLNGATVLGPNYIDFIFGKFKRLVRKGYMEKGVDDKFLDKKEAFDRLLVVTNELQNNIYSQLKTIIPTQYDSDEVEPEDSDVVDWSNDEEKDQGYSF